MTLCNSATPYLGGHTCTICTHPSLQGDVLGMSRAVLTNKHQSKVSLKFIGGCFQEEGQDAGVQLHLLQLPPVEEERKENSRDSDDDRHWHTTPLQSNKRQSIRNLSFSKSNNLEN